MPWWAVLIIGIGSLIIGGILGFIITENIVQKQLRDNPFFPFLCVLLQ